MKRFPSMLVVLGLSAFVAGCAAPPPRAAYYDRDGYRASARVCGPCGYIEDIERVSAAERGTSGAGAVIGAIVGGVLGNTVGKGDGRKAATVAGAVAGGAIGNNIGGRNDRYYTDTETRCRTVHDTVEERRIAGYDVQYRYRGDVFMSRLDYDPGERMRVRVSVTPAD